MVIKRYLTISVLIVVCFLSAFFSLFNGFISIIQAEQNVKKEIKYGYQNEVKMYIESMEDMNIEDLLILGYQIENCNIYIDDLRFYFDECEDVYCPEVLLCQNEKLPYPTRKGSSKISKNKILIPSNIVIDGSEISIHGYRFQICDEIDTDQYEGLKDYFVLQAEDYFQAFEEEKISQTIQLKICSNKTDIYDTYIKLKEMIQKKYPNSYISYDGIERNSTIFSGLFSGKTILGILLYLFALINVMIISFYWVNLRKREVAIRKAYGAANHEIVVLLLKEMLLIITVSAVIAFLAQMLIQIIMGNGVMFSDWIIISLFYLGMIIMAALISVLVPIIYILKIQPAEGVKL